MTVSNDAKETDQKPSGFFLDLHSFLSKYPALSMVFNVLVGAVAGLMSGYFFIDKKVNAVAEKRLEPYEKMFSALSLNEGSEFSSAADEFKLLVSMKSFESLPQSSQELAYDGLILAMANSDSPERYHASLVTIQDKLSKDFERTPWRLHEVGWVLMRTGRLNEAKQYFQEALDGYKIRREFSQSVDPLRGLLHLALFEGDVNQAVFLGEKLKKLQPSVYRDDFSLVSYIRESQQTRMFDGFNALYGDELSKAVDRYVDRLNSARQSVSVELE